MEENIKQALYYLSCGLSVIPIERGRDKKPPFGYSWGEYQQHLIPKWKAILDFKNRGIAIVGGKVSGNLEIIDFDDYDSWEQFQSFSKSTGLDWFLEHSPIVSTPDNGIHIYTRLVDIPEGNKKLALDVSRKTKVETRGEGGYALAPGSFPDCHSSNKPYTLINGKFDDIPIMEPTIHEELLSIIKNFNEFVEKEIVVYTPRTKVFGGERPGDIYNKRGNYFEVLRSHQWRVDKQIGNKVYWTRPGKLDGVSATSNYKGSGLFYVFSSNAVPFQSNRAYSPFAVYAILEHNGNLNQAAKELYKKGYRK